MPNLTYEPLPLPWRGEEAMLVVEHPFADLKYQQCGTDGIRIRGYADRNPFDRTRFEGWVEVTGPLSSGVASAHRSIEGKTLEETRQCCNEIAGLLLAALGLERLEKGGVDATVTD